ncbi:MFS transporter [Streptomyces sp. NPDC058734]|uniref:MFS transporter n=1 Tax=Streptomyces sp. NPDC058734 TaxID=3346615 RepID=UPI0036A92EA3
MDTTTSTPFPGAGRRTMTLSALLLASTLTVMAGTVLAPVVATIRTDLGVSGTAAGLILTAHGLSLAITSPFVGWAVDRWGLRTPMAAGLVLYGVAGGAGLFADSYAVLIASRFVFGIGAAAVFTGTTVALMALFEGPERDRVAGWRSTAIGLGGVVWPLIAGVLAVRSWHGPFAIYLVGIPVGIAMLFTMPRIPATGGAPGGGGTMGLFRTTPRLLGMYALSLVSSFLLYVLIVFLPQRFDQIGVEDPLVIAAITAGLSLAGSGSGLFYGRLRAAMGYVALLRCALVLWGLAFVVGASAGHAVPLALAALLFGAGSGISVPALAMWIGETAPAAMRGRAMALSGTANFAGQFAAPVVVGPLVGATSITVGFVAAAALCALVLLVLLFLKPGAARQAAPAARPQPRRTAPSGSTAA